jgi:hypothetical protein
MAQAIDVDDAERRPLLAGMGASRIDTILPARQVVDAVIGETEALVGALYATPGASQ